MRATRSRTARGWREALDAGLLLGCLLIAGTAVAASGDLTVRPCTGDNDNDAVGEPCAQSTDGLNQAVGVVVSDADNDVVPDCVNTTEGLEGASDLVVSPDGESLYVVGATDDTLTILDRNPINGDIAAQGCIEIGDGSPTSECAKSAPGLFGATGVAISPNGRSVYTAAFGNAISQFARTP